jgi:fatty-acid desaturase
MFAASSNTITKIQLITSILAIFGFFYFDFTVSNIVVLIISFYAYSVIGIGITLHRYYSHKSFEFKYSIVKWIFTFIAVLAGRGSPLGWVYVHRKHHAYSDTNDDPHSPLTIGFKLFGFQHIDDHSSKIKYFLIRDMMDKNHLFINKWYYAIIGMWLLFLGMIDPSLIYFTWVLPVMLVQLSQNCFNYFCHGFGYRNFKTSDLSTNNVFMWPFIFGDAWHNNHHHNAKQCSTKIKSWELDPAMLLINVVKTRTVL